MTFISDRDKMKEVAAELRNMDNVREWEFQNTKMGYTGYQMKVLFENGSYGEIQLNTPRMIFAKEPPSSAREILGDKIYTELFNEYEAKGLTGGLGHEYYELYRKLKEEATDNRVNELIETSKKYYDNFDD
jgi:hypothetical protein